MGEHSLIIIQIIKALARKSKAIFR